MQMHLLAADILPDARKIDKSVNDVDSAATSTLPRTVRQTPTGVQPGMSSSVFRESAVRQPFADHREAGGGHSRVLEV